MTCSHVRFVGGGRWATIVLTELVQAFPCLTIDWVCNSDVNKKNEIVENVQKCMVDLRFFYQRAERTVFSHSGFSEKTQHSLNLFGSGPMRNINRGDASRSMS